MSLNHHGTSPRITDAANKLADIADNPLPGELCDAGAGEYHRSKSVWDFVLIYPCKDDRSVTRKDGEPFLEGIASK